MMHGIDCCFVASHVATALFWDTLPLRQSRVIFEWIGALFDEARGNTDGRPWDTISLRRPRVIVEWIGVLFDGERVPSQLCHTIFIPLVSIDVLIPDSHDLKI
eukprot:127425_1